MSETEILACDACGVVVPRGRVGCQTHFDRFTALAYAEGRHSRVMRIAFDAYGLQHPDRYCLTPFAHATRLIRLGCGVEHDGDPQLLLAVRRWLIDVPADALPPIHPPVRTPLSIVPVARAPGGEAQADLALRWAAQVWRARREDHALVRGWIAAARERWTHGSPLPARA